MTKKTLRSAHFQLFMVLLAGMTLSALIAMFFVRSLQSDIIYYARSRQISAALHTFIDRLESMPDAYRIEAEEAFKGLGVSRLSALPAFPTDSVDTEMESILKEGVGRTHTVHAEPIGKAACPNDTEARYREAPFCQRIYFTLNDGTSYLWILAGSKLPSQRVSSAVVQGGMIFFFGIFLVSWLVSYLATQSLRKLSDAANRLNLNQPIPSLPEKGTAELKATIHAFNQMQSRIQNDMRERTGMLAAITHDLQTPVTRMKLRLEIVGDEHLRAKLEDDLNSIQQLLDDGLLLAGSLESREPLQKTDIGSLLDSVCSDAAEAGQPVRYMTEDTVAYAMTRPLALQRALLNLVENAVKYGVRAEVSLEKEGKQCRIRVRDYGPGIPEHELENVLKPFYRLNNEKQGTGLGLAITGNIVKRLGGELVFCNLPTGGLSAEIILNCAV
ncbi:MAG: ATP-binding protein [Pseudomonadota bacterium]